jgi:hypothetical protein
MRVFLATLLLVPALALGQATQITGTAKGTTTRANVTATSIDANHTGLDVAAQGIDTVQSACVLNALNATCTVALAGKSSAGFVITAVSSPVGITLVQESSRDNTSFDGHPFADVSVGSCISVVPNTSLAVGYGKTLVLGAGDRWVRIRVATFTSGSVTVAVNATDTVPPPTCPAGVDAATYASGVSTATTLTLIGGPQNCTGASLPYSCCTAANTGAGCIVQLTSIVASASAASTTTTDQQLNVKYGTGATCGTGTTYLVGAFAPALGGFAWVGGRQAPITVPAGNNVCWIHAATGSKILTVTYNVTN